MMLCKADFEELFPDIFRPLKSDPVRWEAGGGALSAWQERGPIPLLERGPPPQLATGPVRVETMSHPHARQPKRGRAEDAGVDKT